MATPRALRWCAWMLLPLVLCAATSRAEIRVTDDVGREVRLAAPAVRIVTLSPHLTELLFELGIGERVVGTVRFADFPAQAREIPRLGDAFSLNLELLLGMQPDLVLAWYSGGAVRSVEQMIALGIPVYFNEAQSLEGIAETARRIGELAGIGGAADATAAAFLAHLAAVRQRYRGSVPVRVFYQMSEVGLYTVNDDHLIGQALALCGGINVFGATALKVFEVSREAVASQRPDLIVFTGSAGEIDGGAWRARWLALAEIPAVARGQLRAVPADTLTRPSFRMAEGIDALCAVVDATRAGSSEP